MNGSIGKENEGNESSHYEINDSASEDDDPETDCDDSPLSPTRAEEAQPQPDLTVCVLLGWLGNILTIIRFKPSALILSVPAPSQTKMKHHSLLFMLRLGLNHS